jgi:hypothetical protein
MKRLIVIALMLIPLSLVAKKPTFEDILAKYDGVQGYTIVDIAPDMIAQAGDVDLSGLDFDLKKVGSLRFLTTKEPSPELTADIAAVVSDKKYETVTSINDDGTNVRIFAAKNRGKKGFKGEVLLLVEEDDEVVFMQIAGDMDISDVMKSVNVG